MADPLLVVNVMTKAIENLLAAQAHYTENRPAEGGFFYLAETLRRAGVTCNKWSLPSCQSLFITNLGQVIMQGTPLVTGIFEVPEFNREEFLRVLRLDQEGKTTFPEFLENSWKAGVVSYEVDFQKRTVTYYGSKGEKYLESYPAVEVNYKPI